MLNWFINPYHDMEQITMEGLALQMAVTGVLVVGAAAAAGLIICFIVKYFIK